MNKGLRTRGLRPFSVRLAKMQKMSVITPVGQVPNQKLSYYITKEKNKIR